VSYYKTIPSFLLSFYVLMIKSKNTINFKTHSGAYFFLCFVFFPFGTEIVPVGIIAGGTVGCSILLLLCLLALVLFLYRQRKGSKLSKSMKRVLLHLLS